MTTKVQAEFLAAGIISDQTQVSAASGDHVLIFDASDNSLKKTLISTIAGGLALDDIGAGDAASTLTTSSGNIILDSPADIVLDADGENILFKDGGTEIGQIDLGSNNVTLRSSVADKDTLFIGNDGGSEIEAMRIDYSEGGRVGIGTSSPGTILHTRTSESTANHNAGGGFYHISNSTAGSRKAQVWLDADNGNYSTSSDGAYAYLEKVGDGGDFNLHQQDSANTKFYIGGSEKMRLASNGNLTLSDSLGVGTGTSAPNSRLQIKKDGTSNYANQTFSNANSTAGITFGIAGAGTGNYLANNAFLLNTGASAFIFGTSDAEKMRIDSSGNVAIGATSAAGKLHIQKDASETDLVVRSNTGGTGSASGGRLILQLGAMSNSGSGNADTQAGDVLGKIRFDGQGTDYSYQGGEVSCIVQTGDGSATRGEQGTRMSFFVMNLGVTYAQERFRIAQNGDLEASDTNGISGFSDERIKKNIADFTGGLNIVKSLQPRTFEYKDTSGLRKPGVHRGFVAQEILEKDSHWVYEREATDTEHEEYEFTKDTEKVYLSYLNSKDALYVSAIKELEARVKALEEK